MNEEKQKSIENQVNKSPEIKDIIVETPRVNTEKISTNKEHELSYKNAEQARADIDRIGLEAEEISGADLSSQEKKDDSLRWTSKELTGQTYTRTLSSVRNRLGKTEKTFSKVVHQPVVEKLSDAMSQTVARPSGILFGSAFSFIGSLAAYLLAKRLGGEMPYSVFGIFFVGGFVFGLAVELVFRFIRKRRKI